jgi:hypothetical protein
MAERHNLRLGVVDPVDRRLNVLFWLMQHYQEISDTGMVVEVKTTYYCLRDADPHVVQLARMGEMDEATLLRRLVNGQQWIGEHLHEIDGATHDEAFGKALAAWGQMEAHLRIKHGYLGCIHGEGQRCPADSIVSCDACVGSPTDLEKFC